MSEESCLVAPAISVCIGKGCLGVFGGGMCVCGCVEGGCVCECVEEEGGVWMCGGGEHVGRGGTVEGYKYWKGGMVCGHVRAMSS